MSVRRTLKNRIKQLREEKGLSVDDLARALNVPQGSIVSWEESEKDPSVRRLLQMANYFNCSLEYLLCLSADRDLPTGSKRAISAICKNPDTQPSEEDDECESSSPFVSIFIGAIIGIIIGALIGLLIL